MSKESLEGYYLNGHIRELLEEKNALTTNGNGVKKTDVEEKDEVKEALEEVVEHARVGLEKAEKALGVYVGKKMGGAVNGANGKGYAGQNGIAKEGNGDVVSEVDTSGLEGETRRGVTSREMSGEMGGDTK